MLNLLQSSCEQIFETMKILKIFRTPKQILYFDCKKFRKELEGHTVVKLGGIHATGKQELAEVLSWTSYPSRKGEEPYTLLNLQQSSEENRKVICVSNQYRLTSYCVPPPELMKNENQCLNN